MPTSAMDGRGKTRCSCDLPLRTVVHDARTPLNVIVAVGELFATGKLGPLTARQAQYVGNIQTAARQLTDVLSLAEATHAGDLQAEALSRNT